MALTREQKLAAEADATERLSKVAAQAVMNAALGSIFPWDLAEKFDADLTEVRPILESVANGIVVDLRNARKARTASIAQQAQSGVAAAEVV